MPYDVILFFITILESRYFKTTYLSIWRPRINLQGCIVSESNKLSTMPIRLDFFRRAQN